MVCERNSEANTKNAVSSNNVFITYATKSFIIVIRILKKGSISTTFLSAFYFFSPIFVINANLEENIYKNQLHVMISQNIFFNLFVFLIRNDREKNPD